MKSTGVICGHSKHKILACALLKSNRFISKFLDIENAHFNLALIEYKKVPDSYSDFFLPTTERTLEGPLLTELL